MNAAVMILRVWALYNRSRFILAILLILFTMEIIPYLIFCVIFSIQHQPIGMWNMAFYRARYLLGLLLSQSPAAIAQVFGFSICSIQQGSSVWPETIGAVQIALGTLMSLLVAIQFIIQSVQMYNATRQFQLSQYFNILAREGMIYFIAYVDDSSILSVPLVTQD